jgi:FkbM family methyltransferase
MYSEVFKILRKRLKRRFYEAIGDDRFSWPAQHSADRKLVDLFKGKRGGLFLEVGGNDGYSQSNTYYLERFLGWRGILVEPIPRLFKQCRRERSRSDVYNYALVADSRATPNISIFDAGLMSVVKDCGSLDAHAHAAKGVELLKISTLAEIRVEAKTLSEVIELSFMEPRLKGGQRIDFMSIDVEGFELNVLMGLDFGKHGPDYLLLELHRKDSDSIYNLLKGRYRELYIWHQGADYSDVVFQRCG